MKLIVTADLHLRDDRPRCRIDEDWMKSQFKIIYFILDTAQKEKCSVVIVGDIFNSSLVSEELKARLLTTIYESGVVVFILDGNHDLPYHNWKYVNRSSFSILWNTAMYAETNLKTPYYKNTFDFTHYKGEVIKSGSNILLTHRLVFKNKKTLPPNIKAITAEELIEEYPDYDIILLGDMHRHFSYEKNGKLIINPGCAIRQKSDMIGYQPVIYLLDTEERDFEIIELPDDEDMVDDEYIIKAEEREGRLAGFAEAIKKQEGVTFSFEDNVEAGLANTQMEKETKKIVREILEQSK